MTRTATPRAVIGHNNPPPDPFREAEEAIDLLMTEAGHWLDGAKATCQAEADAVSMLLDDARKASKVVNAARRAEKKPHDDAIAEIQARYRPLLTKAEEVADAAKAALADFLAEADRKAAEERERARLEAEEARKAAELARQAAAGSDAIDDRLAARAAEEAAAAADVAARIAAKAKGKAKGGRRAVTLRTYHEPEIADLQALMAWLWRNDRPALEEFAMAYLRRANRARWAQMDGVTVRTSERPV